MQTIFGSSKTLVVTATRAVINRATGAVSTAVRNVSNAVSGSYSGGGTTYYTDATQCVAESKPTRKHYDSSKTKTVRVGAKKKAAEHKEEKKESFFDKVKGRVSNSSFVQKAGQWWNDTKSTVKKKASQIKENAKSVVKTVQTKAKAAWQSTKKFCSEHKQAIKNIGIGLAVIAEATVLTVLTGGAAAAAIPMLLTAAGVGLAGAGIGAVHHRVTTGSWKGAGGAAFDGFGMGFRVGADLAGAYAGVKAAGRCYQAYKAYRAVKTAEASATMAEATYLAAEEAPELENAAQETMEVAGEAAETVIPKAQQLQEAVTEWAKMERQLANSNRQFRGFNTASVAYDSATDSYFYGMNRGIQIAGGKMNEMLSSWLPQTSLNRLPLGNCAEVDAVNNALNAGSKVEDLYLYTINVFTGAPKEMCANCVYTFAGRVAGVLSEVF